MKKPTNGQDRRWAFARWYHIRDLLDPSIVYLSRLRLVETPWFGVYLHAIRQPDTSRDLHNHPWGFITLILRGGYYETWAPSKTWAVCVRRGYVSRHWRLGSVHRFRHGEFHAIVGLDRRPVWTLVLVGPRISDWGFATAHGFVPQDEYKGQTT